MSIIKTMVKKPKASWDGFSLKPRREMPEGLWIKCPGCGKLLFRKAVVENLDVCPECNYHFRIGAADKIKPIRQIVGPNIRIEVDGGIDPQTTPIVTGLGADTLVAGFAIFSKPNRDQAIEAIRNACKPPPL